MTAALLPTPELVIAPAGSFLMGSPDDEAGRVRDGREEPRQKISFARSFAIGRFAVTVGEFEAFVEATGHTVPDIVAAGGDGDWRRRTDMSWREPGFAQTDRHPVVGVGWGDAAAYAAWLGERSGRTFRLPTECEWEYAARAGTQTAFHWGDAIGPDLANYDARHSLAGSPVGGFLGGTRPVESFAANAWGLYQAHGNVWEWCADDYAPSLAVLPADGSAWLAGDPVAKTLRGGSWLNGPWVLRSASRLGDPADFRHSSFGFRVVSDVDGED